MVDRQELINLENFSIAWDKEATITVEINLIIVFINDHLFYLSQIMKVILLSFF